MAKLNRSTTIGFLLSSVVVLAAKWQADTGVLRVGQGHGIRRLDQSGVKEMRVDLDDHGSVTEPRNIS
jgi:hypothetical protein